MSDMKRKETMCAKYVQMVPALLRKRWLGACVLVLGLHGALGAEPSTISEIRDLLASPGQFKDCVFKDDKFHRCGWSTNGFFIATSENENELKSLNATKFVVGRFGNAFWKSGGGAVTIMDQTKIDAASFQKHFGDVAAFERLAFKPVSFGVLPMAPGPVKFSEFNIFESRDFLGAPFTGGLSVVDDQHITIDYTIPSLPGWKYRSHVAAILGAFPFSEFTIASGPEGTNYIDGITVRYCEISHDEIPSNYFHPTNILAAQIFFCKLVEDQTEGWVEGCMLR